MAKEQATAGRAKGQRRYECNRLNLPWSRRGCVSNLLGAGGVRAGGGSGVGAERTVGGQPAGASRPPWEGGWLKIEELEAERSKLEGENRALEVKLEKLTLQGDYDPSKTKVLHFSMNPASLAKQQRKEEQQQLQEECERLRELVRVLEGGGSIPENLEGVGTFQSPQEIADLKKQVESAELKNQRLKEVFQTKIQEFRKVCYTLTGYQIDITTENQYRLTSIYAEHQGDCLLFKACSSSSGKMQLLETEFSRTIRELIELHLLRQDSIPAFLSALTLDLFSRQTIA
ncbi:mitotic spindle assembly checkpoint protein MAD1 isoform X2 [Rhea pennata]|uniref:mitotic spindle assembly checkpoint protein MAD1 isoform X2 n=1 Tax=Rhea pennata TaxID=8795 RepID=UPI002E25BABA